MLRAGPEHGIKGAIVETKQLDPVAGLYHLEISGREFNQRIDSRTGFCIACGNFQGQCDEDARELCDVCGRWKVYGLLRLLNMGLITFEKEEEPTGVDKVFDFLSYVWFRMWREGDDYEWLAFLLFFVLPCLIAVLTGSKVLAELIIWTITGLTVLVFGGYLLHLLSKPRSRSQPRSETRNRDKARR